MGFVPGSTASQSDSLTTRATAQSNLVASGLPTLCFLTPFFYPLAGLVVATVQMLRAPKGSSWAIEFDQQGIWTVQGQHDVDVYQAFYDVLKNVSEANEDMFKDLNEPEYADWREKPGQEWQAIFEAFSDSSQKKHANVLTEKHLETIRNFESDALQTQG